TVWDSWDRSTRRTRTAWIGQNRELSSRTPRTKVRAGREKLKEPRVNGILPRVFTARGARKPES
ncbi:hypothetical protein KI387_014135, partial [Taxus chinensis]